MSVNACHCSVTVHLGHQGQLSLYPTQVQIMSNKKKMTLPVLDDRKKVQRIDDICFSNRMNFLTSASLMTLNACYSK